MVHGMIRITKTTYVRTSIMHALSWNFGCNILYPSGVNQLAWGTAVTPGLVIISLIDPIAQQYYI